MEHGRLERKMSTTLAGLVCLICLFDLFFLLFKQRRRATRRPNPSVRTASSPAPIGCASTRRCSATDATTAETSATKRNAVSAPFPFFCFFFLKYLAKVMIRLSITNSARICPCFSNDLEMTRSLPHYYPHVGSRPTHWEAPLDYHLESV